MLQRFLARHVEHAYAFLRFVAGLAFAFHGIQKLFGVLVEQSPPFASQLWIGGVIELVCGFAIAFGAFTTYAAFLASGTMAVAYVQFHWKLDFGTHFFPAVNHGELSLVYAVLFLYVACRGAGRASLDALRGRA